MEEEYVPLPKINKIPFIVFDVLLVLASLAIYFSVEKPLSPINAFWIIIAIGAGGVVACLPFLVEFRTAARLKEYDLSQANTENARRIESALLGIQEIGESVIQQTDRSAEIAGAFETLLERMEHRINEIHAGEATSGGIDPEQLREALAAQFESVREDFAQAIAEQAALSTDKQHDKLNAALSKLQGLPMQVTLLSELAGRYQSLVAMISDTAVQLIESTPAPVRPEPQALVDDMPEAEEEDDIAPELDTAEPEEDVVVEEEDESVAEADDEAYGELEVEDAVEESTEEAEEALYDEEEHVRDFGELDIGVTDEPEEELVDEPSDTPLDEVDSEAEYLSGEDLSDEETELEVDEALDELEDDFDIALSEQMEEPETVGEDAPEAELEEEKLEAVDEGMGFDDWDDFGEIAASEEAEDPEPAQVELMADIPEMPKSKPKKQKGVTTLIAQVLIGIGNKPYVRGVGPGLSEDEGVPMEFLEIGKWQWVAPSSDEPVTVWIYKNDETPAEGAPIEIPAGQRRSVAPKFPS